MLLGWLTFAWGWQIWESSLTFTEILANVKYIICLATPAWEVMSLATDQALLQDLITGEFG